MPTVRTNDVKTYYERRGSGPPIVFVHGAIVDFAQWTPQLEALSDEYTAVAYDVRGHGRTGGSERESYSIDQFVDDLETLVAALGRPAERLSTPTTVRLTPVSFQAMSDETASSDDDAAPPTDDGTGPPRRDGAGSSAEDAGSAPDGAGPPADGGASSTSDGTASSTVDGDAAGTGRDGPAWQSDGGGSVRVVGTAHVSAESVEEVERVVAEEGPDVVAVELDEGRYNQLQGEAPEELEPGDLLKGSMAFQFLAYWLLSYVQTRLGERFDITPGADMKAGIDAAEAIDADVALVDRDIQVTIQRFWARMSIREKLRMVWELALAVVGVGGDPEEEEWDIENLTDVDVVSAMMAEFRRFSPGGAEALIDERDAFIAHNLHALREHGADVVAVVGAGHREGIERYLANPGTLPPMAGLVGHQKKRFSFFKLAGYLLTVGFLVFFILLVMAGVENVVLFKVFGAWFLFNGIFAFGMAKLAGAHWTSATVGGAVAWLTSLNPLLAPGWFAGYVELRHVSVSIGDVGTLNELISDEERPMSELLGEMLDVPLFRLIAVVAMTNVGSMIASFAFPFVVLPFIGGPFDSVGAITRAMQDGIANSIDLIVGLF